VGYHWGLLAMNGGFFLVTEKKPAGGCWGGAKKCKQTLLYSWAPNGEHHRTRKIGKLIGNQDDKRELMNEFNNNDEIRKFSESN